MHAAKSFVSDIMDIELTNKQSKNLTKKLPKGNQARTEDGNLTRERLRHILAHCDVKGNALFLFLASSGIRVGEALNLQISDIDMTSEPVSVRVRGENTKAGNPYSSFISSEAKEALSQWLNVRDSYFKSAMNKGSGLSKLGNGQGIKAAGDNRLFPFSMSVADSMWVNALKKVKLDERDTSTDRSKFHIHMLRKFFNSQMKLAGVPEDLVEALIGHNGYLDGAYRRYSAEEKKEYYLKGEPFLLLNVSADEKIKINTKIDAQNSRIDQQQQLIADLTTKLTDSNVLMIKFMAEKEDLKSRQAEDREKMLKLDQEKAELEGKVCKLEKEIIELHARTMPLINRIDEIADFLDKRDEEKWAEEEAKLQEHEAEELSRLNDEFKKKQEPIDWAEVMKARAKLRAGKGKK